jgi:hypothetical protein
MINRENYNEVINEFGVNNLDPVLKAGHENYLEINEFYNEDEDIKTTIDLYLEKLGKYISKHKSKEPTKISKEKPRDESPVKKHAPKKEKQKQTAPKQKVKKEKSEKSIQTKMVRILKEEVKFIKRFVGLHNKKKSASAILAFIKALQKSIIQKSITINSPFVKEIEYIQDKLIHIYNEITKRRKQEELILLDDKVLSKMVSIAGGESVYPSVSFMKAFIGMEGKIIDAKKKDNFLERLKRAVKSEKIKRDDPFAERLDKIYEYFKTYKAGKKISISKAELNGLEGIVKECGCKNLGKIYNTKGKTLRRCEKKTYSDAKKGACSHNKGLAGLGSGVMTAEQVANLKFELLSFDGTWENLFGKPEKNFTLMVHGEPGAGKSTFLIKFAKYLTNFGKVFYMSSEEHGSVTLTNLVNKYLNPLPQNLVFASSLDAFNISDYDFVIYDSINDLGLKLPDFKKLKAENPNTAFIMVLQNTKDGQYKGGKEWEHEAQIAGEITNGTISIYKNRYGAKNSWYFFDN